MILRPPRLERCHSPNQLPTRPPSCKLLWLLGVCEPVNTARCCCDYMQEQSKQKLTCLWGDWARSLIRPIASKGHTFDQQYPAAMEVRACMLQGACMLQEACVQKKQEGGTLPLIDLPSASSCSKMGLSAAMSWLDRACNNGHRGISMPRKAT